ncbi:hypothetical protein D6C81_02575 [Aureobasidium pullulans]|nr:hypothetical protein D6C81_02575 [Aureobasidium pullulans]
MPGVIRSVEMHNVFKIALVARKEALTITLPTETTSENVTIVQSPHEEVDPIGNVFFMKV